MAATGACASSLTGQGALRPLASTPLQGRQLQQYELNAKFKVNPQDLRQTEAGMDVLKVAKNGKLQSRRIAVASHHRSLLVTTTRIRSIKGFFKAATRDREISAKTIHLSTIIRIQKGPLTNRFLLARDVDEVKVPEKDQGVLSHMNCISIIYRAPSEGSGPHRFETLDLVVPSKEDYLLLTKTLEDLLALYQEECRHTDASLLFLQYIWLDLDKNDLQGTLSQNEWVLLCERMNVPLKKPQLTQLYKDYALAHDIQDNEGLYFADVAYLVEKVRRLSKATSEDVFDRLWKEVVETDPVPFMQVSLGKSELELQPSQEDVEQTISAVAFLSFIRSQQKEFSVSLENVTDLIEILNSQRTALGEEGDQGGGSLSDRLNKERFVAYLTSDSNDLMNPRLAAVGWQDMTLPLSHYWINSSHDTYLAKLPKASATFDRHFATDVQMYTEALYRGVRALEVDAWDGLYGGAVVARRLPSTGEIGVPFSDVLRAIGAFVKLHPQSFPVVLLLENHCSLKNQESMAKELDDILGDLLYRPADAESGKRVDPLPSPAAMRGKVIIKSKRPKLIKEGATVMNDDFDDLICVPSEEEADLGVVVGDDDEEEEDGRVIGFDAMGPIRSTSFDAETLAPSPAQLLESASLEADKFHAEAAKAKAHAEKLDESALAAESHATALAEVAGLTPTQVRMIAKDERQEEDGDVQGVEIELITYQKSIDSPEDESLATSSREEEDGEGLEVHDFFEGTVKDARSTYSEADIEAVKAIESDQIAEAELNAADKALRDAEAELEASYQREKDLIEASERAANEARANREYADTARKRIDTVREMLRSSRDGSASAETVVVTAKTEAKISEQRATEIEKRASRALAAAERDLAKADAESLREEQLEQEAASLHSECIETTREARAARDRMEKAAGMLDRVNEQIKLIEGSSHFRKEMDEIRTLPTGDDTSESSRRRHVSKFVAKHASKLEERNECTELLKIATAQQASAEQARRRIQNEFEDKASAWKKQAEIASKTRKQADRSSTLAEELAESAEEEREAANLRHIALEKAEKNVHQSGTNIGSIQAQLAEAERASAEASRIALESRTKAEKLSKEASSVRDHGDLFEKVETRKRERIAARKNRELAASMRAVAEVKVADAKRLLAMSSEVYTQATREAAAEVDRANTQLQAERAAAAAYNSAIRSRKQAEEATAHATKASELAAEKSAAAEHARAYKEKLDSVALVSPALAKATLLHSCKYKNWEKSLAMPDTYMHSFPQNMVVEKLTSDDSSDYNEAVLEFTHHHMCRTFPPWEVADQASDFNYDPVVQWRGGCQLVSMNFHASDEYLLVNDGRFRENGSCGYVLKPESLTDEAGEEKKQRWTFEILSGHCIPKPESLSKKVLPGTNTVRPYVVVSLFDGATDTAEEVHKTLAAKRNGLNPIWRNDGAFEVLVENPAIAMLLFSVWDDGSGDFVAATALPVSCMRQGYRSIALYDSNHTRCGPYAFASLFVKAQKQLA